DRRARRDALRRPEAAHGARTRGGPRAEDPGAGRRALGGRLAHRAGDPGAAPGVHEGPHHDRHHPPALGDHRRRSHPGAGRGPDRRAGPPRGARVRRCPLRRALEEPEAQRGARPVMTDFHEEEDLGKDYDRRLMGRFLGYVRPYLSLVGLAFLLMAARIGFELIGPLIFMKAVDGPLASGDTEGLLRYAGLFGIVVLGTG